jgi:hypothetical protein
MRGGILLLPIAALTLGACSSTDKEAAVDPNLFPSGYRQDILDTMRASHTSPTFVTEAAVGTPALRSAGQDQRYAVCVRATSRRSLAGPGEPKEYIAWFWGGRINQLVPAQPEQCAGAAYTPWPELQKMCAREKCV